MAVFRNSHTLKNHLLYEQDGCSEQSHTSSSSAPVTGSGGCHDISRLLYSTGTWFWELCQCGLTQTWDSGKRDDSAPPHLSQQQKKEHGDVSRPLNFPEFGASVHSAMKACRSVMWIGSWVWCCELKRAYI